MKFGAQATGIATFNNDSVLDVWFPSPELIEEGVATYTTTGTIDADALPEDFAYLADLAVADADRGTTRRLVTATIGSLADAPVDTIDAYLRLHLLSHRLVTPNSINLDGVFGKLNNVVWTNFGPCAVEGFEVTRAKLSRRGTVTVYSIDKFPRMVDYVTPTGVRIGDADRVRLGAHLAEGTTVMHEGFVNFNAGTLGHSMVEGRISQGVVVDDGSDVGGGASIMGTLSGGGKEVVSVGKRCLLGANAGLGISLGDDCALEAGLYITAGTKCHVALDGVQKTLKARELSGGSNMLFRRNSLSGAVEVVPWAAEKVKLSAELHAN